MDHSQASDQHMCSAKSKCVIQQEDFENFLNNLEEKSVDLILTDPPYTISRKTGFSKGGEKSVKRFSVSMEFGKWDISQINLDTLATSMFKVLRKGGTAIVWYDIWKLSYLSDAMKKAGFKMLRVLIWEKTNPVPLNMRATYLSNSREIAVVGVRNGKPTFSGSYDAGIYSMPIPRHNGQRLHPTQKPLQLFCELIEKHSRKGDWVIDPFLGSGTAAVAALKTERKFKGCDIDTTYVAVAKKRVKDYRPVQQTFKKGPKADLVSELAQPDATDHAQEVSINECKGKYEQLQLGNEGGRVRDDRCDSGLASKLTGKRNKIVAVKRNGYKEKTL